MRYGAIRTGDRQALFKINQIQGAIGRLLNESAADIRVDYRSTVATHTKPAQFFIRRMGKYERHIYTDNENYYRLDVTGAKPHVIRARNKKVLAFHENYTRKNKFRTLASFPGGGSGKMIFRQRVNHPGFKPIEITIAIGEKWETWFPARFDRMVAPLLEK